mmetsp:Transcript_28897/g.42838  ORF Transcript_28897/g.42838 Transcript_28897/m.42838 type:complete len:210 (+) Transcript_28897:653-1282(+)
MHTQSRNIRTMVKKPTPVAAFSNFKKILSIINIATNTPGKAVAVSIVFRFQSESSMNLESLAEVYPATPPEAMYSTMMEVRVWPLSIVLINPQIEARMTNTNVAKICIPVPTATHKILGKCFGGRKTSPCKSFHPVSSIPSSNSSSLYCKMSFLSVRTIMIATEMVRTKRTKRPFKMANVWTLSLGAPTMYTSHRLDQNTSGRSTHSTS